MNSVPRSINLKVAHVDEGPFINVFDATQAKRLDPPKGSTSSRVRSTEYRIRQEQ